jgi:putative hydrolase of the HAD superfamily
MILTNPKVIFLDIGGVLLTNGWDHKARQRAAKHFDLEYPVMDAYHAFIFNIYEIGQITLNQYLDTVVFQKPRDFTHEEFSDFIKAQSEELPGGFISWLSDWKKTTNHRVIAINNEGKELNDFRIKKFGLKNCFDAFVSSCEVGMRKPDPGIFRLAMGIAQTTPDDSIYFDDRPMLAAAAARLGMNALVHDTFEKTKSILENLQ